MATLRTPEGKWILWLTQDVINGSGQVMAAKGSQIERWAVDAKLLIANGEAVTEPPENVEPKLPPAPPRHVEVKPLPSGASMTASPGEKVVIDTARKPKGGGQTVLGSDG